MNIYASAYVCEKKSRNIGVREKFLTLFMHYKDIFLIISLVIILLFNIIKLILLYVVLSLYALV